MAVFGNVMMVFNQKPIIPLNNFISYWKFDGNSLDSVGANDGTTTDTLFVSGLIGQSIEFKGDLPSLVNIPDSNNLSFGNGTIENDFSTIHLVNVPEILPSNSRLFQKINFDNSQREYACTLRSNGTVEFALIDTINNVVSSVVTNNTISLNTWHVIITTYEASTKKIEISIDGVFNNNVQNLPNSYVAMSNSTADLIIGNDVRFQRAGTKGKINVSSFLNIKLTPEQVAYAVDKLLINNQHLI